MEEKRAVELAEEHCRGGVALIFDFSKRDTEILIVAGGRILATLKKPTGENRIEGNPARALKTIEEEHGKKIAEAVCHTLQMFSGEAPGIVPGWMAGMLEEIEIDEETTVNCIKKK